MRLDEVLQRAHSRGDIAGVQHAQRRLINDQRMARRGLIRLVDQPIGFGGIPLTRSLARGGDKTADLPIVVECNVHGEPTRPIAWLTSPRRANAKRLREL